jgi:UDP-N-acetylglucosamine 2-epimerase
MIMGASKEWNNPCGDGNAGERIVEVCMRNCISSGM